MPYLSRCCLFQSAFSQNNAVRAYIDQYKDLAISEMLRTGVPASITLAQGILESGAGKSELVQASNNHFGIKCKGNWTGDVVYHDDDAKGECFRSYTSATDSYKDHSDFLSTRPLYASLFDLDPTDYEAWAKGLKKAGYATNPVYANLLIKTIRDNNLDHYTDVALQMANEIKTPLVKHRPAPSILSDDDVIEEVVVNVQESSKPAESANRSYPDKIFKINNTKVVYARSGSSLFALATRYHISYNKLLAYNELGNVDIIDRGQLIFLEKKQKKGSKDFHLVNDAETLEDIAQQQGVQLDMLVSYNSLPKSKKLITGSKVFLRPVSNASKLVSR